MHIVVMIGDQELSRWPVPVEAATEGIEGLSWEEAARAREEIVARHLDYVKVKTEKVVRRRGDVTYWLMAMSRGEQPEEKLKIRVGSSLWRRMVDDGLIDETTGELIDLTKKL